LRRREFVTLASAAVIWPLAFSAQAKPTPVIGILNPDVGLGFIFDAFVEGMRDLGYVDGKNISYVRKEVQGRPDSIPSLAAELVGLKVDVIVTVAPPPTRAVGRATTSIPVVFLAAGDPVSAGLVSSLAHPGGNITGLSFLNDDLSVKRLDLLRDLIPNIRDVAVFDYQSQGSTSLTATEQAGKRLGLQLRRWQLPSVDSFEAAFQGAAAAHVDAVDVLADPYFNANRERLGQLAAKYRLPAIYESADYVRSGCLMGYGPVFTDMARRGASFVDKILKGAKPSDLPIEITTKFELSINLKAANSLGLTVPMTLLARADLVIE
jgi:putative tryptophan/tyrosine transport system substrate-binding protein